MSLFYELVEGRQLIPRRVTSLVTAKLQTVDRLVRLARGATSAAKPAMSPVNAPPWMPTVNRQPSYIWSLAVQSGPLWSNWQGVLQVRSSRPCLPWMHHRGCTTMDANGPPQGLQRGLAGVLVHTTEQTAASRQTSSRSTNRALAR